MTSSHRLAQISELLKQELGALIIRELELPAETLVTITGVTTSRDLGYADVSVSVLPATEEKEMIKLLKDHRRQFQGILAKKVALIEFPTLRFHLDHTEQKATRIEQLLDNLKKDH